MKINHLLYLSLLFIGSCNIASEKNKESALSKSERIINKSVNYHGGSAYDSLSLWFKFRDKYYYTERNGFNYRFERYFLADSALWENEWVTPDSVFISYRSKLPDSILDKTERSIRESLNSVNYFITLPARLQDPAVKSKYLGTVEVYDSSYYKIKVEFRESGGGDDFEDKYLYWFDTIDYHLKYLAYTFKVNGGGARFREAINRRRVQGVLMQNYFNYKPITSNETKFLSIDSLFENGGLKKVSIIKNEFMTADSFYSSVPIGL